MTGPSSNQPSSSSEEELEFKRKHLPLSPGCYLFKNEQGTVLYVGKAKSLRKRVSSYWKDTSKSKAVDRYSREKLRQLQKLIADVEVFVVENEMEALLLENELIKQHQPRFNVLLRDSKSYPWVQITKEAFPRVRIIRSPERYGLHHTYIGPFVDSGHLKQMLKFIRKIFPYCTCKKSINKTKRSRPCTYFQINLCPAPCVGKISQEAYQENIQNVIRLLQGDIDSVAET
ncbi:MAG: GIY-YIG nuclease family protein, partial [Promethearchaeota archaeon]